MVGHGGSTCSAGSYLADPTSPHPLPLCCNCLFKSVPVYCLLWLVLQELMYCSHLYLELGQGCGCVKSELEFRYDLLCTASSSCFIQFLYSSPEHPAILCKVKLLFWYYPITLSIEDYPKGFWDSLNLITIFAQPSYSFAVCQTRGRLCQAWDNLDSETKHGQIHHWHGHWNIAPVES